MPTENDKSWFNVYIIFDQRKSGLRAFQLFQRIAHKFDQDFSFGQQLLSIDCLADPLAAKQACYDVTQADLIVVAIEDETKMTEEFRRWAASWELAQLDRQRLLAVVLDDRPSADCGERTPYLRQLAQAKGLDFITTEDHEQSECDPHRVGSPRALIPPLRQVCRDGAAENR